MLSRNALGSVLSDDQEVGSVVAHLIPIMCIFMFGDTVQCITNGVLRGMGKQTMTFVIKFFGFAVIGLSVGASLAFATSLGVYGLWWGFTCGIYFIAITGLIIITRIIDWNEEAKATLRRLKTMSSGIAGASGHVSSFDYLPESSHDSQSIDMSEV